MRGLLSPRFCMQGKHNQTVSSSTGCDAEAEPAAVVVRCEVLEAVAASGTPTGLEGADDGEDADAVDEDAPGLVVEMAEARAAAICSSASLSAWRPPLEGPGHHHKQKVSPQRLQFEGPAHHH